jgi:rhomboid family GlyGly-CTERM serine protease
MAFPVEGSASRRPARDATVGSVGHYTNPDDIVPMKPLPALTHAPLIALLGAAIVLALQGWPGAGASLQYETARNAAEPWRLLTAHSVHLNWRHAIVNAAAWIVLARLFAPDLSAPRQLIALVAGATCISAALALFYPGIAWYRGLSGVLHALYFAGAATWSLHARTATPRTRVLLPVALFVAGWIKVALEQPRTATLPIAAWLGAPVVPQAHLLGALSGTLVAFAFAAVDARRERVSSGRGA